MPTKVKTPGPVPKIALDYFKAKGLKPAFSYLEVWKDEHTYSFTAAKVMENDILRDLQDSITKALEQGIPFKEWSKEVGPMLDQSGWSGYHVGVPKVHRLQTIYQTNVRVARSVGVYERSQRTKKTQPYFLYQLGPSRIHRPEHVAWNNTILPVDDPFWDTHTPINSWGCKCHLIQIAKRQADRLGGVTARPSRAREPWENKLTGKIEMVPKGIDPGWDYNPGKSSERRKKSIAAGQESKAKLVLSQDELKRAQKKNGS